MNGSFAYMIAASWFYVVMNWGDLWAILAC